MCMLPTDGGSVLETWQLMINDNLSHTEEPIRVNLYPI